MRIEKGTHRIALVGEDFTLKAPRSVPLRRLIQPIKLIKKGDWGGLERWKNEKEGSWSGLTFIMAGILQNLREAGLSDELGEIVAPTLFSLQGLLNLQESAQPLKLEGGDFQVMYNDLYEATNGGIEDDPHTFGNQENYGWHKGEIKLIDYGDVRSERILRRDREKFKKVFATHSLISQSASGL